MLLPVSISLILLLFLDALYSPSLDKIYALHWFVFPRIFAMNLQTSCVVSERFTWKYGLFRKILRKIYLIFFK
jgi:hypothetical protein